MLSMQNSQKSSLFTKFLDCEISIIMLSMHNSQNQLHSIWLFCLYHNHPKTKPAIFNIKYTNSKRLIKPWKAENASRKFYFNNFVPKKLGKWVTDLSLFGFDKKLFLNIESFLQHIRDLQHLSPNFLSRARNPTQVLRNQIVERQNRRIRRWRRRRVVVESG